MRHDGQPEETTTLDVDRVLHITDKAMLCAIEGGRYWIPFSVIDPDSELIRAGKGDLVGASGEIEIPAWFARKESIV